MRTLRLLAAVLVAVVAAAIAFVYLAPATATDWAMALERRHAGLQRKEIVLPDGLRYAYLEGGQGEPLMLLHGFGARKENFTRVAAALTPRFRVIVPDHIGFGDSARPPQADYTAPAQAERVRALARALGVRELHLGGSSMGGHIALAYAQQHPSEVKSLWLISPSGLTSAPESEFRRALRETGRNGLLARSEEEYARLFELVMSDPPFVPRPMLDAMARERIVHAELEQRIFEQFIGTPIEDRIGGLATPALVVWGEQDRVLHVGGAAVLKRLLPRSELVVMPGVGHLPMLERPGQVGQDYLRFRERLGGP